MTEKRRWLRDRILAARVLTYLASGALYLARGRVRRRGGSQVDRLGEDGAVAAFQVAGGDDVDGTAEQRLQFAGHVHEVEQGAVLVEVDEQVDVAAGAVVGGFQVGATVTANFGLTTLSGIGYDPDQGWEQICSAQTSDAGGSATPFAFTSGWDMKVGIAADLEASFYNTGGVFVGVRPFLEGVAQNGNPYFVGYWGVDVTSGTRFDIGGQIATFPFVPTFRQQIPQLTLPPPTSPTPTPTPPTPTPTPTGAPPVLPPPPMAGTVYVGLHDSLGSPNGPVGTRTGDSGVWHDTTCTNNWTGQTTTGSFGAYSTQPDSTEAWASGTGTTSGIQWWTAGMDILSANTDYAVYADIDTCNAGTTSGWYTLAGNDDDTGFGGPDVTGQRNLAINQAAASGYVYLGTENTGSNGISVALVNGGASGQVGAADIRLVKTGTSAPPPPPRRTPPRATPTDACSATPTKTPCT